LSINRLYIKELISFDEVELEFGKGLIVVTGPSGAGKSLLMQSILSSFGYGGNEAKISEVTLNRPKNMHSEAYELDNELVIKSLKKDRSRLYLNSQNISKKTLYSLFSSSVKYLSVRDKSGFESATLIDIIDRSLLSNSRSFEKLLKEYQDRYRDYKRKLGELNSIKEDEKRLSELIEYTTYEIEKIKSIDPKIDEDRDLIAIKQKLSKIDKINDALSQANSIFMYEESIYEVFRLLDKDIGYFNDAMSQLHIDFEESYLLAEELADVDVEEVLDRLEKLSWLKSRYGSLLDAIEYCKSKERELIGYQNIEQDKSKLESFLSLEYSELKILAQKISRHRQKEAIKIEKELSAYLLELKLPDVKFLFEELSLEEFGIDSVDMSIGSSTTSTLSGGEFNRLRLALLVVSMDSSHSNDGIIILDEIDANVSGDESIAIANMISKLSKSYQLFAISHQAHLSAKADQHILVNKSSGVSYAKVLDEDERIAEISRIIGGEELDREAVAFAQKLRDSIER